LTEFWEILGEFSGTSSPLATHADRNNPLARIIHERSIGLPLAHRKSAEYAGNVAYSLHFQLDMLKSEFPYSSTKLGFVNNPG
jgi:hypothetical protein